MSRAQATKFSPPVRWWLGALCVPVLVSFMAWGLAPQKSSWTLRSECTGTAPGYDSDWADAARDVLFKRLEHYALLSDTLGKIFYFSLLCIGIALATVLRHTPSLNVQGVTIPTRPLRAAIVVVMTYLWFELVFVVSHLVDARAALMMCTAWLEGASACDMTSPFASLQPLLRGSPFIDAWTQVFGPEVAGVAGASLASLVQGAPFIVGMAVGVGLAHAVVYTAIQEEERSLNEGRMTMRIEAQRWLLVLCIVYPYVSFHLDHGGYAFSILASLAFVAWCCGLEYLATRRPALSETSMAAPESEQHVSGDAELVPDS